MFGTLVETAIKGRIIEVLRYKEITTKELCAKRGLKNHSALSDQLTVPATRLGYTLFLLIAERYPDISTRWILTGQGEMLNDTPLKEQIKNAHKKIEEYEYLIDVQKRLINELYKTK